MKQFGFIYTSKELTYLMLNIFIIKNIFDYTPLDINERRRKNKIEGNLEKLRKDSKYFLNIISLFMPFLILMIIFGFKISAFIYVICTITCMFIICIISTKKF